MAGLWALAKEEPLWVSRFLTTEAAFTLPAVHERLLGPFRQGKPSMLLELLGHCCGRTSTVLCTRCAPCHWPERLGSGTHAAAIMDHIVHNTERIEADSYEV